MSPTPALLDPSPRSLLNLSARYKFKQPADPTIVTGLAAAELEGSLAGGLPENVHGMRRGLADTRRWLAKATGDDSIPLLKDLARISRQLEECEEALDVVLAAAWKTGPYGHARCSRCHRRAPTAGNRLAAHTSGSVWCSGSGAVFKRSVAALLSHFPSARRVVIIDNHELLVDDTGASDRSITIVQSKRGLTGRYSIDPSLELAADTLLEQFEDGAVEIHKDRYGQQGIIAPVGAAPARPRGYTGGVRRPWTEP